MQPWGLYLIAEAGYLESLQIDVSGGAINVTFGVAKWTLNSMNMLRVEKPSELQNHQEVNICVLRAPSSPPGTISSPLGNGQERLCRENVIHWENQDSESGEMSGLRAAAMRL